MATHRLTIRAIISPELQELLDRVSQLECTPEIVDLFLQIVGDPSQIICIDGDVSAASAAGEFGVVIQPTDFFRKFMAAVAL